MELLQHSFIYVVVSLGGFFPGEKIGSRHDFFDRKFSGTICFKPFPELLLHSPRLEVVVEIEGAVAANFREGSPVGSKDWFAVLHRFQNGESETFREGGEKESFGVLKIPVLFRLGHGPGENTLSSTPQRRASLMILLVS